MPAAPDVRLLAVVNDPDSGPGRFGPWLAEHGVDLVIVSGDEVPSTPAGWDGLLLLGGGLMPDDDERAPWLARERDLTRAALRQRVPLLGVCLGGQLLAHVTGGTVVADSGRPEMGSVPVRLLPAAADDALFGGLPETFPVIQHHRDEVTVLPDGAVHLATSAVCPHQAFRIGDLAWGLQFHPEVGADRLDRWRPERLAADGFDLEVLRREASAAEPRARVAARALLDAFVGVVRACAAERLARRTT